jgi:hypothetical protein
VITALICPGGHGLCESAFGSAYAAKVHVGKPELMQSRPEGTPKCLEGREPTDVEPPAAPKVECRGAARTQEAGRDVASDVGGIARLG